MLQSPKRPRTTTAASAAAEEDDDDKYPQPLLPGLPDHLAQLCLSRVPPSVLFSVCRPWRQLIYSPSFPPFLSLYALLSRRNPNPISDVEEECDGDEDPIALFCYDPIAGSWSRLPEPPPNPPLRRLLIHHPSFLSRCLPIQSVATDDHLVLLAASTHRLLPALSRPLAFHPPSRRWRLGPPFRHPRRWCSAGSAGGIVYLASGVGSSYRPDVARSAERWDPRRLAAGSACGHACTWEPLAALRDGRFSREAVEAVAAGGKLCMVNVRGKGAKEGMAYDIAGDRWEEMPPGMLAGWTGPAASAAEEGPMYVVDEGSGELRAYEWELDRWRVVAPAAEGMRGAVAVATGRGKVCVAVAGGAAVVVVDVAQPGKTWALEPPAGRTVIALHVLPRIGDDEF